MTDLFDKESKDDDKSTDDKSQDKSQEGSLDTYLGLILNDEGKQKYATAEEALKGSVHAQSHITNLEKELKGLREKDDKDAGMEKILEALNGKKDEKSEEPQGITQEQLADVVTQLLDKRENVSTQKQNITTVVGKFKELYGEKASETMYGKAKDLGFNQEGINQLIVTNPTAALKILGVSEKTKQSADPTISSHGVNTDGFQEKGDEKRESSMGYISEKQLTSDWEKSKAATLKRLEVEITS